jgi:tRNA(fMet)-specific endonuclease VapC
MLVLDTSAVSAVMHGLEFALERLRAERPSEVVLVAPVAAEIAFGLARLAGGSRRRRLLEDEYLGLRNAVRWADWTEDAAGEFGRQKARLEKAGRMIEDVDIAIAAIALVLDARVATLNAKHFKRIGGLSVEDWRRT